MSKLVNKPAKYTLFVIGDTLQNLEVIADELWQDEDSYYFMDLEINNVAYAGATIPIYKQIYPKKLTIIRNITYYDKEKEK